MNIKTPTLGRHSKKGTFQKFVYNLVSKRLQNDNWVDYFEGFIQPAYIKLIVTIFHLLDWVVKLFQNFIRN
jgi:hypothetical protein